MVARHLILEDDRKPMREQVVLSVVVIVPFAAVLCAAPMWRQFGMSLDIALLGVCFYAVSMLGVTVGFHRLFTHRAFRANRVLRICLAIAGSLAIQGPLIRWVADHRRHHAFADRDGDPHSPWRFGGGFWALLKGILYAHVGWMFDSEETSQRVFAPDISKDIDARVISRCFGLLAILSIFFPVAIEWCAGASVHHIVATFFWATMVRVFMVHHVTWSVNSICHVVGSRPFSTRDKSTNFWPLAVLSMGEAWHNGHHAAPSCARHGVQKGQIDPAACVIRIFEWLGWATNVKWPRLHPSESPSSLKDDKRAPGSRP